LSKFLRVFLVLLFVLCTVSVVAIWQGLNSFLFAWVLNFMLMLGVAYITQIFKLSLTSSYYNPKYWEAEGKIYKWFGIQGYRKFLVWVGWEKLNKSSNPVKKNLDALKHMEYSTRKSEFGHLIIFFIVLGFTFFVGLYYGIRKSMWLVLLNIILNAYPIGVQRYNRPRLQRAITNIRGLQKI